MGIRSAYGPTTAVETVGAATARARFPYPPIERIGVIGDRRSAAVTAADGTICWLCWPNFDSPPVFASLIDLERGGFWRLGPESPPLGHQRYANDSITLITEWEVDGHWLELSDFMPFPETERSEHLAGGRTVLRRLRCLGGEGWCKMDLHPRGDFQTHARISPTPEGATITLGELVLSMWASVPLEVNGQDVTVTFLLREGEEAWFVIGCGDVPLPSSAAHAKWLLEETEQYWKDWANRLSYVGFRSEWVRRSAMTFHLMTYAPTGALVAAPTSSLPERIGGDRNYDYRFAWIRDVSLALAILATLGDLQTSRRYMDWLSGLKSENDMPLQVLYRIDGGTCAEQEERAELEGYRGSTPVRIGNHAADQYQIDSLGYLADCALVYLEKGGEWKLEYWDLVRRLADHAAANWQRPTNGIWELSPRQHYVADKVMAWVTLERSIKIAKKLGSDIDLTDWERAKAAIFDEVMEKGWSESMGAFKQRYEAETLDASVLLMAMMEFLPADHPRMRSTIERIDRDLTIDGLVYRFNPPDQADPIEQPLGEAEGAFLPCTFWLAAAHAMLGNDKKAQAILEKVESIAGDLKLFAEEVDPAARAFLGNTPLLFSHAVYIKAVMEIVKARPLSAAEMMIGRAASKITNFVRGEAHQQNGETA